MKNLLLSACAAALIATATLPAAAGSNTLWTDDSGTVIVRIGEDRYRPYGDPYAQPWPGEQPNRHRYDNNDPYGDDWEQDSDHRWRRHDNGWNNGWGHGWGNGWNNGWGNDGYYRDVIPPRAIVKWLKRRDYTYITRPMLSGRFYQVKAIAPNGRKVKLYIDAYSGRIVKTKRIG